jgi:hypothetical protein
VQLIDAADPQKNKLDELTIGIIQVSRLPVKQGNATDA